MKTNPSLQDILTVSSEEALRQLGTFQEIRSIVNKGFGFTVPGKGRGWKGYYARIVELQHISQLMSHEDIPNSYFSSNAVRYIYALAELDGEHRARELCVSSELYYDKSKARHWRNQIATAIHPDRVQHPKAGTAMSKLSELYASMTQ